MALFTKNKKDKTTGKKTAGKSVVVSTKKSASKNTYTHMQKARAAIALTAPWMSEKALIGTDSGVYVFAIPRGVTKQDVARAVEVIYKVTPRRVCTANLPGKRVSHRTRAGVAIRSRRRKAYVYLNKGDTIQLV